MVAIAASLPCFLRLNSMATENHEKRLIQVPSRQINYFNFGLQRLVVGLNIDLTSVLWGFVSLKPAEMMMRPYIKLQT